MLYCPKCSHITDDGADRCPHCRGKKLRPPKAEDECFLVEKEAIWGDMLRDVLTQNGIPCLSKGNLGAALAMSVGRYGESYRFYVPYAVYPAALDIVEALFSDATVIGEDEAGEGDAPGEDQRP